MMTRRKGQVVIFFIIAIVILFTMVFLFYVVKQNAPKDLEKTMGKIKDENLITDRVYDDVQSCFNQASAEGIKMIGRYAGYMPTTSGGNSFITPYINKTDSTFLKFSMEGNLGLSDSDEFLDYNGEKIVIMIKNNENSNSNYPCKEGENCSNYKLEDNKTEISKWAHLPRDIFFNKKNIPKGCKSPGFGTPSCDGYCYEDVIPGNNESVVGTPCFKSVQASTERYIKNYFFQCINSLRDDLAGYTLYPKTLNDIKIDSYFAKTNVEFFVKSKVYLKSNLSDTLIEFPKVNSNSYDIGLKAFYERGFKALFARETLIANENIVQDLSSYLEDYDHVKIKQYIYNNQLYDIISIFLTTDKVYSPSSSGEKRLKYSGGINGAPFNFTFARANRRPALEYINNITVVNNEATINFRVADPDEDVFGEDPERNNLKLYLDKVLFKGGIKDLGDYKYKIKTKARSDNMEFKVCDGARTSHVALCDSQEIKIPKN